MTLSGNFVPIRTTAARYSHVPASVGSLATTRQIASARGGLIVVTATPTSTGTTAIAHLLEPATTGTHVTTQTDAFPSGATFSANHVVAVGATTNSYALDVGAALLAFYASTPTVDAITRAITWTDDGGAAGDFVVASYATTRDNGAFTWTWSIAASRGAMPTLQLPTLPTDVFDFNVRSTDLTSVRSLVVAKVPGGYDAARAFALDPSVLSPGSFGAAAQVAYVDLYSIL